MEADPIAHDLVNNFFGSQDEVKMDFWFVEQFQAGSPSLTNSDSFAARYKEISKNNFPEIQITVVHYVPKQP